jgi:hypothetical protein
MRQEPQFRWIAGVGVGAALTFPCLPVPKLSFMFVFALLFVFWLLRPRLPLRRRGAGVAGVAGVAGSAGVAGVVMGSAGVADSAGVAGVAARALRCRDDGLREAPVGVNEQTWFAPGTVISVRRSPDFLARIETIVGVVAGDVPVAGANSPNCIATPV